MDSWCWSYLVRIENREYLEQVKKEEQERHQSRLLEIEEMEKRVNHRNYPYGFETLEEELAWVKSRVDEIADGYKCKLPDGTLYCASVALPNTNPTVKNRYGLEYSHCPFDKTTERLVSEASEKVTRKLCVDCGEEFFIKNKRLHNGDRCSSCKVKFNRHGNFEIWAKGAISRHKKKGYQVEISVEWLTELARNTPKCQMCKCELVYGKRDFEKMASLDRKDNGKIITTNNVGIICHKCNRIKGNTLPDIIAEWVGGLKKYSETQRTPKESFHITCSLPEENHDR